ncbi:hypothetical protein GDO81_018773 [Engystomops pustulosus]|uniref:Taste receptor type 2 n=1 Tax=Engystomops pustulosus TaxID=76066 RepID=A0AAV6ZAN2_ENGPU|nr:hypothetical protein GDO81_018773 [Engystomops pustulosus]
MLLPFQLFTYTLELFIFCFMIPTNMFIFIVNLLNWIKVKKLLQVDQLITSISACYILEEVIKSIRFIEKICDNLLLLKIHFALSCMVMSCNVWFSTFLCVYFCLKIVNVKNTLYICLQRNFQKILPWLFVSAILGSVLVSLPFILNITKEDPSNIKLNTSAINRQSKFALMNIKTKDILSYMTLSWIAMLILPISAFTIVTSLLKHINQVQQSFGGFRSPNMKAHVQALSTIISFLVTNVIILLVFSVNVIAHDEIWNYLIYPFYSLSKVVICWNLIKGNRNLKKTLKNIFSILHCTNTSNDVE